MGRNMAIWLLGLGALAGFASGIFGCHFRSHERRQAFEDHVADVCTRAAERAHVPAARGENQP